MRENDWFFDRLGNNRMDEFDKSFNKMQNMMIAWMIFCAVFAVLALGTGVWLLLYFFG